MQLYQEKERVLTLEQEFHRSYYRTITVNIPKGYKITNLNDINIDNSYSENGKEPENVRPQEYERSEKTYLRISRLLCEHEQDFQ